MSPSVINLPISIIIKNLTDVFTRLTCKPYLEYHRNSFRTVLNHQTTRKNTCYSAFASVLPFKVTQKNETNYVQFPVLYPLCSFVKLKCICKSILTGISLEDE